MTAVAACNDERPTEHASAEAFVDSLVDDGLISHADRQRIAAAHASSGESWIRLLPKLGLIEETLLCDRMCSYFDLPRWVRDSVPEAPVLADRLSPGFLKQSCVLPVACDDESLWIAVADPFDRYTLEAVRLAVQRRLNLILAEPSILGPVLDRLYRSPLSVSQDAARDADDASRQEDLEKLKDLATEAPVIRLVNDLLSRAVELGASDVHLESSRKDLVARMRVDGLLRVIPVPAAVSRTAVVSRVKLLAQLDIAERRLPQDGRIRVAIRGKEIDLRVSTFPTLHGESVVIRLLDKSAISLDLAQLGFAPDLLDRYLGILAKPSGIVLVTGPTGSGKTTTLYGSLMRLERTVCKVVTVEDPIEYELPGINQTQIRPQIGLTFATALRSLVRHDPDVMLVGEIRDGETAEIAAQAALTGHKVLSTLHTNDAASSVTRLLDLGLADYLITATLDAVVAQRLVRVLCRTCRRRVATPAEAGRKADPEWPRAPHNSYEPVGCDHCGGTGYRGRIGIYELLLMSDEIRDLTRSGCDVRAIERSAVAGGMTTMYQDGLNKVASGVTTLSEVHRVTHET